MTTFRSAIALAIVKAIDDSACPQCDECYQWYPCPTVRLIEEADLG